VWGKENAGTKNVKVVLVTDGVYTRYMKSGEQPGRGLTIIVTTEETEEGARRWRQHKEVGGSEEDTSDGVRDLGAEMDRRNRRRKRMRRMNRKTAAASRRKARPKPQEPRSSGPWTPGAPAPAEVLASRGGVVVVESWQVASCRSYF
jgi:hypothetical protein